MPFVHSMQVLVSSFGELVAPAAVFAAIVLLARGTAALRRWRAASAEVRTNLVLFALDVAFVTPLLAAINGLAGAWIERQGLVLPVAWSALPVPLVALIAVLAGDFVAYGRHRLEHTAPLWPSHAVHHSDTAMTWTTGLRFHPVNRLTTALIDTTVLAFLGLPVWALAVNNLVRHYYGLFVHVDVPWTFGPLGRVFVSPAMHRWHHVRDAEGAGVNFATVFSVFDLAFGTWHVPGPCDVPLGVREDIGDGALAQLAWPVRVVARWIEDGREPSPTEASPQK